MTSPEKQDLELHIKIQDHVKKYLRRDAEMEYRSLGVDGKTTYLAFKWATIDYSERSGGLCFYDLSEVYAIINRDHERRPRDYARSEFRTFIRGLAEQVLGFKIHSDEHLLDLDREATYRITEIMETVSQLQNKLVVWIDQLEEVQFRRTDRLNGTEEE